MLEALVLLAMLYGTWHHGYHRGRHDQKVIARTHVRLARILNRS